MGIIQELLQGSPKFTYGENGEEYVEYRPPTSKELRAARHIEQTHKSLEGLAKAFQTLEAQYKELMQSYDKLLKDRDELYTRLHENKRETSEVGSDSGGPTSCDEHGS